LICWTLKKKQLLWEIDLDNIDHFDPLKDNLGIEFVGKTKSKRMPDKKVALVNCDQFLNAHIHKKIGEVKALRQQK